MQKNNNVKDEMAQVEIIIGKIMRIGVLIAAIVMIIGLVMFFINGGGGYVNNAFPTTLSSVISGITHGKAYALMMGGIFLLILTPVLRVVVSIYTFIVEKDTLYTWITILVLVILIISFIIGHN